VIAPRQPAAHAVGKFVSPSPHRLTASSGTGAMMAVAEDDDLMRFPLNSLALVGFLLCFTSSTLQL
jgi:hypothetical protein